MSTDSCFLPVEKLLTDAVTHKAFPCATIELGGRASIYWQHAFGTLSYNEKSTPATLDTVFDLASLTKVISTTTLIMRLVDKGKIRLNDLICHLLDEWQGQDRIVVTVTDLLEHTSGLTSHLPFYKDHQGRYEFQRSISTLPLEYMPRHRSLYSDLGFILLAFLATDAAEGVSVNEQFEQLRRQLEFGDLRYLPPTTWRSRTAPTEIDTWRGRLLRSEVHDENGWALGGVAGHTGLFGTAPSVGRFARAILQTLNGDSKLANPSTLARFLRRSTVPGSSRALGWDTMLVTSSCGRRFSPASIGHTGFTGTSLWIDPKRDLYVVLLTNRVHPARSNEAILRIRPLVHDAVVEALDR